MELIELDSSSIKKHLPVIQWALDSQGNICNQPFREDNRYIIGLKKEEAVSIAIFSVDAVSLHLLYILTNPIYLKQKYATKLIEELRSKYLNQVRFITWPVSKGIPKKALKKWGFIENYDTRLKNWWVLPKVN